MKTHLDGPFGHPQSSRHPRLRQILAVAKLEQRTVFLRQIRERTSEIDTLGDGEQTTVGFRLRVSQGLMVGGACAAADPQRLTASDLQKPAERLLRKRARVLLAPGADEGLLDRILGLGVRAQYPLGLAQAGAAVPLPVPGR